MAWREIVIVVISLISHMFTDSFLCKYLIMRKKRNVFHL